MKTIDEIRRDNLLIAVARAGSASALAELAGVSSVYLSQIKNMSPEAKTGKAKTMGDDVARKIEMGINEPQGWMDADHSPKLEAEAALPDERVVMPDEVAKLFQLYFRSTIRGRKRIIDAAELAAKIEARQDNGGARHKS